MPPRRYPFSAPFHDAVAAERALKSRAPREWAVRGERAALALFQQAARRVPAYRDILARHRINPELIRTIADFTHLPIISKATYLREYPLADLSWDGKLLDRFAVYAATSGSTGEPFYFPRAERQTDQYALLAELYLRTQYRIHERKTLYVNCFAMGAWIGGLFTCEAIERLARSGRYPLHFIAPGIVIEEALKAIRRLGPAFDQVIIGGYPPHVKDLVDQGTAQGMDWTRYRVQFVFSAEGFSEGFREYVARAAGQINALRGSLNHYGTVDLGTMAYETPLGAFIRRAALKDTALFTQVFGTANRLPTFAQYLPEHFYFECLDGGLVATADAGLPLIRYDLLDQGGVRSFEHVTALLEEALPDYTGALVDEDIADTVFKLPFVYLYERSDFVVTLYGLNIYPEHVRRGLEHEGCSPYATGKCAIRVEETHSYEPRLEINVELKPGIEGTEGASKTIERHVFDALLEFNAEYRDAHSYRAEKVRPRIALWPYRDPKHFSGRGKQHWTVRRA